MEGKPNQLYAQGMRSFEQYDEICKYFTEGKQRDNDVNPHFLSSCIIMDLPIFVIAEWATLLVDIRCPRGGS